MRKQFLVRWLWTLVEYLMIFPVLLIISGLLLPVDYAVLFTLSLPLHTLSAIIITLLLKKFSNILVAGTGSIYILLISLVWFIASSGDTRYLLVYVTGSTLFFIRGVRSAIGSRIMMFFYTGGLVIHGVSLFLLSRIVVINPYFNIAMIASIVYVAVALPLANRHFLINESQHKNSLSIMPSSVIRGNKVIVICLLSLIGLLSIGKYLLEGLIFLTKAIGGFIDGLMRLLSSQEEYSQPPLENNTPSIDEIPQAESNPVMEMISDIVAVLVGLAILYFIIKYIIKHHKQIIKSLMEFFSRILNRFQRWSSTEQSYTDRQESLLKTDETKRASFISRLFRREKGWKDMKDNSSRTRFIYTKFVLDSIKKGFKFRVSDSPSETVGRITEEMKDNDKDHGLINETYNLVCYGKKKISDETIKILKDKYL